MPPDGAQYGLQTSMLDRWDDRMRKVLRTIGSTLLGLAVVAGAVISVWFVAVRLAEFLVSLKSDLAVAVVAASVAGLVSIVTLIVSKRFEARSAALQSIRDKKTPVYEGIVSTLFRVMFASMLGEPEVPEADLVRWFAETTEKLSIWGSDDLIKAFGAFKTRTASGDTSDALFAFEDLILAIRKDLGHGTSLSKGDILRQFVNDIDDYL